MKFPIKVFQKLKKEKQAVPSVFKVLDMLMKTTW